MFLSIQGRKKEEGKKSNSSSVCQTELGCWYSLRCIRCMFVLLFWPTEAAVCGCSHWISGSGPRSCLWNGLHGKILRQGQVTSTDILTEQAHPETSKHYKTSLKTGFIKKKKINKNNTRRLINLTENCNNIKRFYSFIR